MTGSRPIIALDFWGDELKGGRVLGPEGVRGMRAEVLPMALPWLRVGLLARDEGYQVVTSDEVGRGGIEPRHVILVSHDWTPSGARLLDGGARPGVVLSFEPPVIAWSFYFNLRAVSARFPHAFVFRGAQERLASSTIFHELHFPQVPPSQPPPPVPWPERRLLVMINSGKVLVRDPRYWFEKPREMSLRRELAALRYRPIAHDRYAERLRAIRYFSRHADFDLYGVGWEQRHRAMRPSDYLAARRAFRGEVADKLATLAGYRFALCVENARFPGYVSEKLFDCFFAGCIPVYDGAPDVDRDVPSEAFVNLREFGSYAELDRFLRSMSAETAQRYLEAGQAYLASPTFQRFSVDTFARDILAAIKSIG